MAEIIELPSHQDPRGSLTVLEKVLPFPINRVYWIYNLNDQPRGRHRHKETIQALVCLQGRCEIVVKKNQLEEIFILDKPTQALLLKPEDWHEMRNFQQNPILLLLASHHYDANDYIKEPL